MKRQIHNVPAKAGSITTSVMFHKDEGVKEQMGGQKGAIGEPKREGI